MATTTFLFVDQVGSTEQLSRLGDTLAQQVRRALFDLLRESTQVHGGHEVDFTGDGLFCAFDSASDAVAAAVAMQQVVATFNERQPPERAFAVRVGLNTGEPLSSEGGGYFGSAVVVAARLCAQAGSGQILASALVRSLVDPRGVHRFEPMGQLRLRGIPDPVEAYSVGWESEARAVDLPPLLAAARRGPFIGRIRELNLVHAALQRVAEGGRQLLLISGDSGIGVTRLAAESGELLRRSGVTIWAGACQGSEARLAAWAEAVDSWARSVSRAELRLAVGDKGADLMRLVPELTKLLPGLPAPSATDAEVSTFLVADAVDALAVRVSDVAPLVVVLDRLHEADPASLTVLRRLLSSRRGGRVMVIGCYEPSVVGARKALAVLADVPDLVDLRLTGLAETEVRQLLDAVAGEPATDDAVRAVVAESEGSPFYVLQMARSMRQQGLTRRVEDAVERAVELRSDLRLQREEIAFGLRQLEEFRDEVSVVEEPRVEPDGTPPAPGASPYRGLLAFTAEDAATFFGREALVAELVAALSVSRWLAVVGPSGSGKSSAVRAGLEPALARGALPGSAGWVVVDIRPGARPLDALGAALAERAHGEDGAALATELESVALGEIARRLFGSRRLVVHVDQFEELWTSTPDDARARTISLLVEAATAPDESVSVVVTMRADYYGRTAEHAALAALMAESQVLVPPMTTAELRAAVEWPAREAGLVLEPGLAQAVVDDVAREPGSLPLLSTAMQETWERRRGRSLTLTGYAETGGARRAIAHLADATFDELDDSGQEVARRLLLRLAAPAADGGDVARPAPLSELVVDDSTRAVLDRLVERRLVTVGGTTAQVAHEALLREWPRLRGWLDADRDGRRLHQQIATAAAEWEAAGREDDALLRGARLAAAVDWRADHDDEMTQREREFLDASAALRERDVRHALRTTRRFQILAAALVVLLVGAGIAAYLAVQSGRTAAQRANEAIARDLVNQSRSQTEIQLDTALLLAVEAYRRNPSLETQGGLLTALDAARYFTGFRPELPRDIVDSGISSDGGTLCVLTPSGELLAFDTTDWSADPQVLVRGIADPLFLDVSPDGRQAVYTAADGAHLVEVVGGSSPSPPLEQSAESFVSFSQDGRFVLLQRFGAPALSLLDAGTGALIQDYQGGDNTIGLVRPATDELLIGQATGDLGASIQRWGLDGRPLGNPVEHPFSVVFDWAYTTDGAQVVVAAGDGAVHLLDADTLQVIGRPFAVGPSFTGASPLWVEPDPSGGSVAIGYDDGTVVVGGPTPEGFFEEFRTAPVPGGAATPHWLDRDRFLALTTTTAAEFDRRRPTPLAEVLGDRRPDGLIQAFVPSPDGERVLYVSESRLREISASGDERELDIAVDVDPNSSVVMTVAPDGSRVAVLGPVRGQDQLDPDAQGTDHTLAVIPLGGRGESLEKTFFASFGPTALAFSPDGETLAFVSGSSSEQVIRLDVRTGRQIGEVVEVSEFINALQYTPDGDVLVIGDAGGSVWPLDVETGDLGSASGIGASVMAMAFTPEGELLLATHTGFILFADPRTFQIGESSLQLGSTAASGLAVSPDGSRLLAQSDDGSLHLWALDSRRALGPPLRSGGFLGGSPGFLREGEQIVTGQVDHLLLWDLDPDTWQATACALAGRNLSEREWSTFLPDEPYRETCSGD